MAVVYERVCFHAVAMTLWQTNIAVENELIHIQYDKHIHDIPLSMQHLLSMEGYSWEKPIKTGGPFSMAKFIQ